MAGEISRGATELQRRGSPSRPPLHPFLTPSLLELQRRTFQSNPASSSLTFPLRSAQIFSATPWLPVVACIGTREKQEEGSSERERERERGHGERKRSEGDIARRGTRAVDRKVGGWGAAVRRVHQGNSREAGERVSTCEEGVAGPGLHKDLVHGLSGAVEHVDAGWIHSAVVQEAQPLLCDHAHLGVKNRREKGGG